MSPLAFQNPVEDSVSKVNDEVAVGEDLKFQHAWWRFERIVWFVFLLIILCDIAGVFGRGPVAKARMSNSALQVAYERVGRYGTPSIVDVALEPSAVQSDGKYHLFVSKSLVDELGMERVVPSPESTAIGAGGLTYTFPAVPGQASVKFALQPSKPGVFRFFVQSPGATPLEARVLVMP